MKFTKYNANPQGKKTGDCTIRAIAFATNQSWYEVLNDLYAIGVEECLCPLGVDSIIIYLKNFELQTPKAVKGKKRPKVKDYTKGTWILRTANHLTCVKDNVNYDTWDCRERCVYRAWKIEKIKKRKK